MVQAKQADQGHARAVRAVPNRSACRHSQGRGNPWQSGAIPEFIADCRQSAALQKWRPSEGRQAIDPKRQSLSPTLKTTLIPALPPPSETGFMSQRARKEGAGNIALLRPSFEHETSGLFRQHFYFWLSSRILRRHATDRNGPSADVRLLQRGPCASSGTALRPASSLKRAQGTSPAPSPHMQRRTGG